MTKIPEKDFFEFAEAFSEFMSTPVATALMIRNPSISKDPGVTRLLLAHARIRYLLKAKKAAPCSPPSKKMYKFRVLIAGGYGPDIWDNEIEVSAPCIASALVEAEELARQEDASVFRIEFES